MKSYELITILGPTASGKTTFAAALAKTLDAHFVVGSYSTWIANGDGHQGDLLKAMRTAFREARENAPSVLLIDEIDNFVQRGSQGAFVYRVRDGAVQVVVPVVWSRVVFQSLAVLTSGEVR